VRGAASSEIAHRADQKLLKFGRPLVVSPVADPDDVAVTRDLRHGLEHAHVSGFVPRPRVRGPPVLEVSLADYLSKGEHAVVVRQIVRGDRGLVRERSVMGVVKEKDIRSARAVMLADPVHELRGRPLVHDDGVGGLEHELEIERLDVAHHSQRGIGKARLLQRHLPVDGNEIDGAPGIGGLVDDHVVAARLQLHGEPAEEVGVAMIPVRQRRVIEQDDVHA
jgi:hypothetical protein